MVEKKLYKIKDGRMIFGVATGLAKYFDIDVVIVRLILVALVFVNGMGIVLYVVLLIIMPELPRSNNQEPLENINESGKTKGSDVSNEATVVSLKWKKGFNARLVIGVFLIILGLASLSDKIIPFSVLSVKIIAATLAVIVGLMIIIKSVNE